MVTADELAGVLVETEDTADARRRAALLAAQKEGGGFATLGAATGQGIRTLFDFVTGRRDDIQRKRAQNEQVMQNYQQQLQEDLKTGVDPEQAQVDALVNASMGLAAIGETDQARQLSQKAIQMRAALKEKQLQNRKLRADIRATEALAAERERPPEPKDELTRLHRYREQLMRLRDANPEQADAIRRQLNEVNSRINKITTTTGLTEWDAKQLGLSTKTQGTVEDDILTLSRGLERMNNVRTRTQRKFLTIPGRVEAAYTKGKEKLGFELTKDEQRYLDEYTDWRATTLNNLNLYIKAITGAQMSIQEAERIIAALPNPDMSHTEFMAALDTVESDLQASLLRSQAILAAGRQELLQTLKDPDASDSEKATAMLTIQDEFGGLNEYKKPANQPENIDPKDYNFSEGDPATWDANKREAYKRYLLGEL